MFSVVKLTFAAPDIISGHHLAPPSPQVLCEGEEQHSSKAASLQIGSNPSSNGKGIAMEKIHGRIEQMQSC